LESKRRGYWMSTLNECSCPSYRYRGGPCKHQRKLAGILRDRAPHLPAGVTPLSSEELDSKMCHRLNQLEEDAEEVRAGPVVRSC